MDDRQKKIERIRKIERIKSLESSQPEAPQMQESSQEEDSGFDFSSPTKSLLTGAAKMGMRNLQAVGEGLEKYSAAPTRSAVSAGLMGKSPTEAFGKQFGEDPSKAPTGKDIVGQVGVPDLPDSTVNPKEVLGEAVEFGADVANLLPVGKVIEGAGKIPKALKGISEMAAFKQAGAMLKDFRTASSRGNLKDMGRTLLDAKVDVPTKKGLVNEPLYKFGDTFDDIAKKADVFREQAGKKLDEVYSIAKQEYDKTAKELSKTHVFNPHTMEVEHKPHYDWGKLEVTEPVSPGFNPSKDKEEILSIISSKMGDSPDQSAAMAKARRYLGQLERKYGNTGLDPKTANNIKSEIDRQINYARNPLTKNPASEQAYSIMRDYINDSVKAHIDDIGKSIGNDNLVNELSKANKEYGLSKTIQTMAEDKASRGAANLPFGLADLGAGGIGAAALGPKGMALGLVSKVARERGPGMLARGADVAQKGLILMPEMLTPVGAMASPVGKGILRESIKDRKK